MISLITGKISVFIKLNLISFSLSSENIKRYTGQISVCFFEVIESDAEKFCSLWKDRKSD